MRDVKLGAALLAMVWASGAAAAGAAEKTVAERLGFEKGAKLLIVHGDDIGMCHAANTAAIEGLTKGLVSSVSCMVPCPWFPEFADWARQHPEYDVGLHLTLTSEWKYYRWRPVSPLDKVKGLIDPEGFMWHEAEQTAAHATAAEVETEIRGQVKRAMQFGVKPTHLDTHMGTIFTQAGYVRAYVKVAREFGAVPMLIKMTPANVARYKAQGYPITDEMAAELNAMPGPKLDFLGSTPTGGQTLQAATAMAYRYIRGLKPGLNEIIIHPAEPTEESQAITNSWRQRGFDLAIFTSPKTKALLDELEIKLVNYKLLRELEPKGTASSK